MNTRQMLGTLGVSAVLACGAALPTLTFAGGPPARQGLEGTWMLGVANSAQPLAFLGLATFTEDGQVLGESNTTSIKSLERGEWFKVGHREYIRSTVNFRFTEPRIYAGVQRITSRMVVTEDGEEFTGEAVVERYDAAGNLISSIPSAESGRRCDSTTTIARCLGIRP